MIMNTNSRATLRASPDLWTFNPPPPLLPFNYSLLHRAQQSILSLRYVCVRIYFKHTLGDAVSEWMAILSLAWRFNETLSRFMPVTNSRRNWLSVCQLVNTRCQLKLKGTGQENLTALNEFLSIWIRNQIHDCRLYSAMLATAAECEWTQWAVYNFLEI